MARSSCSRTSEPGRVAAQPAAAIWWVRDGKPGHDNQAQGLIEALGRRLPTRVTELAPEPAAALAVASLRGHPQWRGLPAPALVVGAGARTQATVLAARRRHGGRAVVLMRPQWPASWFDLCIVPEHDNPVARDNLLVTCGAVNRMRPAPERDASKAIVLIGGPSRHFRWDDQKVIDQVLTLCRAAPQRRWLVSGSRRTPQTVLDRIVERAPEEVEIHDARGDWLARELPRAGAAWITPDSASMIYEALTAGVPCGVLELPARRGSRVARGVARLRERGWVMGLDDRHTGAAPACEVPVLDEAGRCADWIAQRWLSPWLGA